MILVIDPGGKYPELGCFNKIAALNDRPLYHLLPAMFPANYLPYREERPLSGIIMLGSFASVNDTHPWLPPLRDFVREMVEQRHIPFLGLCFGHQFIAHLFGGAVGFIRPKEPEWKKRGLVEMEIRDPGNPIFAGLPNPLLGVASHREEVTRLGAEWRVIATSDYSPNQAIQWGTRPVYGFQLHLEAEPEFMNAGGIAHDYSRPEWRRQAEYSATVLKNFLGMVRRFRESHERGGVLETHPPLYF